MTRNDGKQAPVDASSSPPPGWEAREVVVKNSLGLHTRPATFIAKRVLAEGEECTVRITDVQSGETAQGNSILAILSLGAAMGTRLLIEVQGASAQKLLEDLAEYFASGFEELNTAP